MTTDIVQRTPEWYAARCGSLGASALHEAIARTKSGYSTSRANLMARLICEKLTGIPQETFQSPAMLHGIDTEPEARAAYEFRMNVDVVEAGLFAHPSIAGTHASPDGLVGDDGLIEIKCPGTAAHLDTLLGASVADKYVVQMQWQLACTGRQWCDHVSYDPRLPESLRFWRRRFPRDNERIAALEKDVTEFLAEMNEKLDRLNRYGVPLGKTLEQSLKGEAA